jgi:hypothetical protein
MLSAVRAARPEPGFGLLTLRLRLHDGPSNPIVRFFGLEIAMRKFLPSMMAVLPAVLISTTVLAQTAPEKGGGNQTIRLMTPEERTEYQSKMRGMKTYDECKAYQDEHRKLMEQRAKDKGITLPAPRMNPCDRMKARGLIK